MTTRRWTAALLFGISFLSLRLTTMSQASVSNTGLPCITGSSALAVPAIYSGSRPYSDEEIAVFMMLVVMVQRNYHDFGPQQKPLILLADDDISLVHTLRNFHFRAWAMTTLASMSDYQFRGDIRRSPIRDAVAAVTYLADPVLVWRDMSGLMAATMEGGFMVIDLSEHEVLDAWLRYNGWQKMNWTFRSHSIYRREIGSKA